MLKQILTMLLSRAIEIAFVSGGSLWLLSNMDPSYNQWVVGALIVIYIAYFLVTFSYDYKDLKYGEGIHRI